MRATRISVLAAYAASEAPRFAEALAANAFDSINFASRDAPNIPGDEPSTERAVRIVTIPPQFSRARLVQELQRVPGFARLELGEVRRDRNFSRTGWIVLAPGADLAQANEAASRIEVCLFFLLALKG